MRRSECDPYFLPRAARWRFRFPTKELVRTLIVMQLDRHANRRRRAGLRGRGRHRSDRGQRRRHAQLLEFDGRSRRRRDVRDAPRDPAARQRPGKPEGARDDRRVRGLPVPVLRPLLARDAADTRPGLRPNREGQSSCSSGVAIIGPDSLPPLQAAFAAGEQNRLWNYAELVYRNQGEENTGWVSDDLLRSLGEAVPGLDAGKMMDARESASVQAKINAAQNAWVECRPPVHADVRRRAQGRPAEGDRRRAARGRLPAGNRRFLTR